MMHFKEQVINNFSLRAQSYDDHADVQLKAATQLVRGIERARQELLPGPILEIGCGTGSLTMPLLELFGDREVIVSDLSSRMLEICRQRIVERFGTVPDNVELRVIDGEHFEERDAFASIVSSFTLHWLTDLESALGRLISSVKPGGCFFFSVPSSQSFPEWKKLCLEANLPFTANSLPSFTFLTELAQRTGCESDLRQQSLTYSYSSLLDFMRELKAQGASTSNNNDRLSAKQLLQLINNSRLSNQSGFLLSYDIIYGKFIKR